MPTLLHNVLHKLTCDVLERIDTPAEYAAMVATSLVGANLAGHDSHGMIRLPVYVQAARAGRVVPAARAVVATATAFVATVILDGMHGWGQPAAHLATTEAMVRAQKFGMAAVVIQHCNHIGRVGEYVERMARANLVGLAMCNANPNVAPFGGRKKMLGTNPISIAVPRADGRPPVLLDAATSVVAEGKLRVARDKGVQTPSGWIIDKDGRPTLDPNDFYAGGALLPMGDYKGYGLGVMVELLGGLLSGMSAAFLPDYGKGNGVLMMALNPEAFMPLDKYLAQVELFCEGIKSAPTAPGVEQVLLPGEPEQRAWTLRTANGIDLPEATWQSICTLAAGLGVAVPG